MLWWFVWLPKTSLSSKFPAVPWFFILRKKSSLYQVVTPKISWASNCNRIDANLQKNPLDVSKAIWIWEWWMMSSFLGISLKISWESLGKNLGNFFENLLGIPFTGLVPSRASLTSWGEDPFSSWCHNKNASRGRCFTLTNFAPHLFLLGWLKANLALLLDQLRLF